MIPALSCRVVAIIIGRITILSLSQTFSVQYKSCSTNFRTASRFSASYSKAEPTNLLFPGAASWVSGVKRPPATLRIPCLISLLAVTKCFCRTAVLLAKAPSSVLSGAHTMYVCCLWALAVKCRRPTEYVMRRIAAVKEGDLMGASDVEYRMPLENRKTGLDKLTTLRASHVPLHNKHHHYFLSWKLSPFYGRILLSLYRVQSCVFSCNAQD